MITFDLRGKLEKGAKCNRCQGNKFITKTYIVTSCENENHHEIILKGEEYPDTKKVKGKYRQTKADTWVVTFPWNFIVQSGAKVNIKRFK